VTPTRATLVAASLALAACGGSDPTNASEVAVDSVFVDALVEVHLADARAALAPDTLRRPALAESLRAVALAAHGLTRDAFDARLADWAADPAVATAHYDAVDARLSAERQAAPSTRPMLRRIPAP
jgi:hypothetical protein